MSRSDPPSPAPTPAPRLKLALYGKGGSGKSMVASNLSVQFARAGAQTLQIGCDPKHDSTLLLFDGRPIPSVMALLADAGGSPPTPDRYVATSRLGVDAIEAGGPEPGVGCAGRGIVTVFQLLERHALLARYDAVVLDVLGDVVCGGFAAPLMHGMAGQVVILVSDNLMALYAANNIAKAVARFHRNGARLRGLLVNHPSSRSRLPGLERFAERLSTRLLGVISKDPFIARAEREGATVSERFPRRATSRAFERLAGEFLSTPDENPPPPTPMNDEERSDFFRALFEP